MRNISFLDLLIETIVKWPIVGVVAILVILFLVWFIKQLIFIIKRFC